MNGLQLVLTVLRYLWPGLITLLFLPLAPLARWTGGDFAWHSGVLEVWGGVVGKTLERGWPLFGSVAAITLGHVVAGASHECIESTRTHERVHVRQFERWGLIFPLAYAAAGTWQLIKGKRWYWDNPFEQEARAAERNNCASTKIR